MNWRRCALKRLKAERKAAIKFRRELPYRDNDSYYDGVVAGLTNAINAIKWYADKCKKR